MIVKMMLLEGTGLVCQKKGAESFLMLDLLGYASVPACQRFCLKTKQC